MKDYFFSFQTNKGNSRAVDYICGLAKKYGFYDQHSGILIPTACALIDKFTSGTVPQQEDTVWAAYKILKFLETEVPDFKKSSLEKYRIQAFENLIYSFTRLPSTSAACLANDIFIFADHHRLFGKATDRGKDIRFMQLREAIARALLKQNVIQSRCTLSKYTLFVGEKTYNRDAENYYTSFPPLFEEEEDTLREVVTKTIKAPKEEILSSAVGNSTESATVKKKKKKKKKAQSISSET